MSSALPPWLRSPERFCASRAMIGSELPGTPRKVTLRVCRLPLIAVVTGRVRLSQPKGAWAG
jgi:hypothetical protein